MDIVTWGEKKMSKDVDTHDLFKGDTFRTAYLSEVVDFICEKKPHNLIIRDLEYVKVVRCKDCKYADWWGPKDREVLDCTHLYVPHVTPDWYCAWGERKEDE